MEKGSYISERKEISRNHKDAARDSVADQGDVTIGGRFDQLKDQRSRIASKIKER